MILGHDYLPSPGIPISGPPLHPLTSLAPKSLNERIHKHDLKRSTAFDSHVAAERRVRAFGHGSQHWDPGATAHMPPGWIRDKHERAQAHVSLLQDVNNLVCFFFFMLQ